MLKSKSFKKFISTFLVVIIFFTGHAHALSFLDEENEIVNETIIYKSENDNIEYLVTYEADDNNQYIRSYKNGQLTQLNIIEDSNSESFKKIDYRNSTLKTNSEKIIKFNDFGQININKGNDINLLANKFLGTLTMQETDYPNDYKYSSVAYSEGSYTQTTYKINNYTGTIIDLATIVLGVLNLPKPIAVTSIKTFLKGIAKALGVYISGEIIKSSFSTTVAAKKYPQTLTVHEIGNTSRKATFRGYRYFVNDTKSNYSGNTYYSGYSTNSFGTLSFGAAIARDLYGNSNMRVIAWYR